MTDINDDLREPKSWMQRLKKYFSNLIRFNVESWKIAFSLALGVFIGLLIPIGFQTIVVIPLALLLKCNIFITTSATMVSNPITVVPLYYLYFRIGEFLTAIQITDSQLDSLIASPTFDNIQNIGENAVILFFSGGIPVSLIVGVLTYWTSLVLINYYRKKRGIQIS